MYKRQTRLDKIRNARLAEVDINEQKTLTQYGHARLSKMLSTPTEMAPATYHGYDDVTEATEGHILN